MRIFLTVAATLLAGVVTAQQGVPPPKVLPPTVLPPTPPATSPPPGSVPPPATPPRPSPPPMSTLPTPGSFVNTYPFGPSAPGLSIPMDFATVVGRVVDQHGRGVAHATVRIVNQMHLDSVLTDSQGRFFFSGVSPGSAVFWASKQGYLDGGYGKRRASGQPQPIALTGGQAITDMRIELFKTGILTGVVTDEDGEPVQNARVVAFQREFGEGPWEYQEAASATTDDTGAYRIYGLNPGEYIVSVPATVLSDSADGRLAIAGGATPPKDDGSDGVYKTLYFSGTEYRSLALPIALGIGETRYAVNFRLALVPAYAVRGRLSGPKDAKVARQVVRLIPIEADYSTGNDAAITMSNSDGTFVFPRVPRGEYRLETNSSDTAMGPPVSTTEVMDEDARPDQASYFARVPLNVVDEDVALGDITLKRSAWAAVKFEFAEAEGGAEAYRGATVKLMPAAPGLSQPPALKDSGSGVTVASDIVPGAYVVAVSTIPPGWYLRSVFVDNEPALDSPVKISDPGSTIVVSFSQVATRLEGTVVDSRSLTVGGATVLIMPAQMVDGILMPNRIRETRTSAGGVFVAEGLPPGDYLVAAVTDAAADGWQNPKVIAQVRTIATRVRLREDKVEAVHLRMGTIKNP